MTRILVTNDDGIAAPGIRALAAAVHTDGYEVVVAAPRHEASGTAAALTAVTEQGRIVFGRVTLPGLPGVPAFAVSATPAYIAVLAGLGTFGPPPDLLLSGINRGANAGHAVLHSGTVGAALTAAGNGVPAMAVSLDVLTPAWPSTETAGAETAGAATAALDAADDEARHWATAAAFARALVPGLPDVPAGTVLNLNVPDLPEDQVRGLRQTGLAPFGQVLIVLAAAGEGYVRTAVEESGGRRIPGTDLAALADGYAAVTPIRSIGEAESVTLKW